MATPEQITGEKNGRSKLNERMVKAMRIDYAKGVSAGKLAERYKVSRMVAWYAVTGVTWKHVGGPVGRRPTDAWRARS